MAEPTRRTSNAAPTPNHAAVRELTRRFRQWGVVRPPEKLTFRWVRSAEPRSWQENAEEILERAKQVEAKEKRDAHFLDLFDVYPRPFGAWKLYRDHPANVNFLRAVFEMKGTPTESVLFIRPDEQGTIRKLDRKAPDHIAPKEARELRDSILREWKDHGDLRQLPVFNDVTHVDSRAPEELRDVLLRCIRHNTGAVHFPEHASTALTKHLGGWMRGEHLEDEYFTHEQNMDHVHEIVRKFIEEGRKAEDLFTFKEATHQDVIRTVYEAATRQSADGVNFHHGEISGTLDELGQDQAFTLRQNIIGELHNGRKLNELSVVRNAIHASPGETPPLDDVSIHEWARENVRRTMGAGTGPARLHETHARLLAPHVEAHAEELKGKLQKQGGLSQADAAAVAESWAHEMQKAAGNAYDPLKNMHRDVLHAVSEESETALTAMRRKHHEEVIRPLQEQISQERRRREALAEKIEKLRGQVQNQRKK